ncbi:hypothetical protein LWP59_27600 [Amycolatopsis acidiphila]|uniref:Uncharacterized protein n=1 Tax=Amycolatopsis acidiphila TaxID=715473 RepID=A0A558A118_9PSEU|nr:hypothetical protein [Amycolatopsis acidiphila]TVT17955.1 hypothetical protein FNH06_29475 [Amycolatopsis acidiphila]TVT17959.1 hypothetical protein FNH06_29495 [Amycolatopsis acidiphila]UIJ57859.1 hypothetical protein LWP59_27480 [Amycolatopsis acidiphila]UIJ57882.1 hypothetical protein LWP59_27600 [Amycolatopsis acidiphila]GHG71365.1 hypothetical protein GCM10017788_33230 [Amycolatopsis acidiphila]
MPTTIDPSLLRELGSGLVDPDCPDGRVCVRCAVPATLYAVDLLGTAWDTCAAHHGQVMLALLRGEVEDIERSLSAPTLKLLKSP